MLRLSINVKSSDAESKIREQLILCKDAIGQYLFLKGLKSMPHANDRKMSLLSKIQTY